MAVAVLALLDGCTLIGLGVGVVHDSRRPKGGPISGETWPKIPGGTRVIVKLNDGVQLKGEYLGIVRLTETGFDSAGVFWRAKYRMLPMPIPLGTIITLTPHTGQEISGRFTGFDQHVTPDLRIPQIWIVPVGDTARIPWNLSTIVRITTGKNDTVNVDSLRRMISRGEIPTLTAVTLLTSTLLEKIPLNRITSISYPRRHGAILGLLIGFGLDIVCIGLTLLFLEALEDSWGHDSWG